MQELGLQIGATGCIFLIIAFVVAGHSDVIDAGTRVKFAVRTLALLSAATMVIGLLLTIWSL